MAHQPRGYTRRGGRRVGPCGCARRRRLRAGQPSGHRPQPDRQDRYRSHVGGFLSRRPGWRSSGRARRERRRAAHRCKRVRHARIIRTAGLGSRDLRCRRALLEIPRLGAVGGRHRVAGALVGARRKGRRCPVDTPAAAVGSSQRVALRPQGGRRANDPADGGRDAAARSAGRVRAEAAAGGRSCPVRAAPANPARSWRQRSGQHGGDRGRPAKRLRAQVSAPARGPRCACDCCSGFRCRRDRKRQRNPHRRSRRRDPQGRREARSYAGSGLHVSRQYDSEG